MLSVTGDVDGTEVTFLRNSLLDPSARMKSVSFQPLASGMFVIAAQFANTSFVPDDDEIQSSRCKVGDGSHCYYVSPFCLIAGVVFALVFVFVFCCFVNMM